jgi:hypothetical protein
MVDLNPFSISSKFANFAMILFISEEFLLYSLATL